MLKSFLFESESRAAALQASKVLWNIHEALTDDPDIFFDREGKDQCCSQMPNPAALVCPKTCDTVAENACNKATHLSIDHTEDRRNTQASEAYSGSLEADMSQNHPSCSNCEVRSPFSLLSKSFLDASSETCGTVLQVYMGKACLKPYDSYPSNIGLSQDM